MLQTMTPRAKADRERFEFWIDREARQGLQAIRDRDGVPESEQVRRAVTAWLEANGVKAERKRAATRKRP